MEKPRLHQQSCFKLSSTQQSTLKEKIIKAEVLVISWKRAIIIQVDLVFEYCGND